MLIARPQVSSRSQLRNSSRSARSASIATLSVLAAFTLALTQGCKKSEEAPPPAPAAPGTKPKAAAGATNATAPATAANTPSPTAAATPPSAGTNAPSDALDLRIKWQPGKRYVQRMEMSQGSESNIPTVPTPTKQDMAQSLDYSITVLKPGEGGGHELEVEFLAQKVESKLGGRSLIAFDSAADAKLDRANPVAAALRKLVGIKIHYLTDASGKLEKVNGAQELQAKVLAGANPQAAQILNGLLNEENLKRVIALGAILPDKPVKLGDKWPAQRDVSLGKLGFLVMDMNYVFKGWEDHDKRRCALLEFTGSITNRPSSEQPSGLSVTIENGKTFGKSWFDPALGMIVDSVSEQEWTMKTGALGQNVTAVSKTKVTIKLTEVSDAPKAP